MQRMSKLLFLSLLVVLAGCAVPIPPTGGPPDSTPPSLSSSIPADGETNVSTRTLEFEFSEPVDSRSFRTSFSITPDLPAAAEFSGSGRTMKVRLPDELREATTYIVTLGVALRDIRGVALSAPLTFAFATGSEIDTASMTGRVVQIDDGSAARGLDIFAYASADSSSLEAGPLYRTQTGNDGRFTFSNLAESSYFVVGVRDTNRNRRIDTGESVALPPVAALAADTLQREPNRPWILFRRDIDPPQIDRVRALASDQIELRFSEPLALSLNTPFPGGFASAHDLSITDSTGAPGATVADVWFSESDPRILMARTDELTPGRWVLSGRLAVADSSGLQMTGSDVSFDVVSDLSLSSPAEFLSWVPDSVQTMPLTPRTVWPVEQLGWRMTSPSRDASTSAEDTSGVAVDVVVNQVDPTFFLIDQPVSDRTIADTPVRVRVSTSADDSITTGLFSFASNRSSGALGVIVRGADGTVLGELFSSNDREPALISQVMMSDGQLLFDDLPRGFKARIRVFADQDGNGRFSPGSLMPFRAPEAVHWMQFPEPVRARWETISPDTLLFSPVTFVPVKGSLATSDPLRRP